MLAAKIRKLLEIRAVASRRFGVDDEASAFKKYSVALTLRNARMFTLGVAAGAAITWALDFVVYASAPATGHVLRQMRAALVVNALVCHLLLRGRPGAGRVLALCYYIAASKSLILGYATGLLGDLGTPWFHFTYLSGVALLVPVVPLPTRTSLGVLYAGALVLGLGLAQPGFLGHPMLVSSMTFLAFTTATGVGLGHILYGLLGQGLVNSRARERAAREVEELNRTLEERVAEQTRELRMLAAHLERAREEERSHIARDLHDELGQELAAMRYALTFAKRRFERDPQSIRKNLDELEQLLARAATTTRQILSDLRPRVLDELGLDAGVDWLLKRTEERTGLKCRLLASCRNPELPVEVSIAAFRILQEALTNVVRHAQATSVEVEVTCDAREIRICVRDDGVGMVVSPRPRAPGKGGMGLIGMRERADALGGSLQLDSRPGAGTTLRVRLPLGQGGGEAGQKVESAG